MLTILMDRGEGTKDILRNQNLFVDTHSFGKLLSGFNLFFIKRVGAILSGKELLTTQNSEYNHHDQVYYGE